GDEHAADIELDAALPLRIEQVERLPRGNEDKDGVFVPSLGTVVDGQRRLVILSADEAVELGVLLRLDRRPRLPPERAAVGKRLLRLAVGEREDDRHRYVGRVLGDHALDRRLL